MISSCPKKESDNEMLNDVTALCESQSLTSPPITDNRTGLVYRNKYCPECHGVPDKEQIRWPSQWHCTDTLQETFNSSGGTVDVRVLLAACNPSVFKEPQLIADTNRPYSLRQCDRGIIYKCQPTPETNTSSEEYHNLERLCRIRPWKAQSIRTALGVYKNKYCALCSSPRLTMDMHNLLAVSFRAIYYSNSSANTSTLLLDVTGSGIAVLDRDNN